MRRLLLLFLLIFTACQPLAPIPAGTPAPSATPNETFIVRTHPDGGLFAGDLVSFEVIPPTGFETAEKSIRISLQGKTLGEAGFQPFGVGQRTQATFYWVWDTDELEAGDYTLTFSLQPDGTTWDEQVTLRPTAELPLPEPDARWKITETDCCIIHYVSGTAAERDLDTLEQTIQTQFNKVEQIFQSSGTEKLAITFLPRTLGHGGFASNGIFISYGERNYAGSSVEQILHHEMVHWIDGRQNSNYRPTILVEGLATYLSGGHFKKEPIFPRAAALLALDWYIPLQKLTDDFYPSQHEIGYLQGAALVGYLIQRYGWDAFNQFYRAIPAKEPQSAALDSALREHFGLSLAQLEQDLLAFLHTQTPSQDHIADLRLSVAYYDTVRRYQAALDPSAYYLSAWLVDTEQMWERGIVTDYLRHPDEFTNRQIESMLVSVNLDLHEGRYSQAEQTLRTINLLMDTLR